MIKKPYKKGNQEQKIRLLAACVSRVLTEDEEELVDVDEDVDVVAPLVPETEADRAR